MKRKSRVILAVVMVVLLAGCAVAAILYSGQLGRRGQGAETAQTEEGNGAITGNTWANAASEQTSDDASADSADGQTQNDAQNTADNGQNADDTQINQAISESTPVSAEDAGIDYNNATVITLAQDNSSVAGEGVSISGNVVTIRDAGTYLLSGKLQEGQVTVDAGGKDDVQLVLSGIDITNLTGNALEVQNAGDTTIWLEAGSVNQVQSGEETEISAASAQAAADATGAAIYARDDLEIAGPGSLEVRGYINNGIHTTNDLKINNGTLQVYAVNHGVKGKDSIEMNGGDMTITAGGDGLQSNDDTGEGYGVIHITGGSAQITCGDDGIHAETVLTIDGGDINITDSYEGLEANQITINGGDYHIVSSDDGINAYGGQNNWGNDADSKTTEEMPTLTITDGSIYIDAEGDGLDSNGDIIIDGGTVIVEGPQNSGNGAIDSGSENGGSCVVNGGTVLAIGSTGMAEGFGSDSRQCSFLYNFSNSISPESTITVTDGDGRQLYEFTTSKTISSVVFSCPELTEGDTVTLQAGSESTDIELSSISVSSGNGGGYGNNGRSRWRW